MASERSGEKGTEPSDSKKIKVSVLELLDRAFKRVPEHEKLSKHPTTICYRLLKNCPTKMLDVISISMRAFRDSGLPPGVKFTPGKSLMKACYEEYLELNGNAKPPRDANEKKARIESWMEMSEILDKTLKLVLEKAKDQNLV
ncbi:hypothetical protein AAMO2058_001294000 [Amorphochlora amoebiformis]|uniref:Uncharacterized protein n=1 Tax=Amorphochlora amoebiformis TaxID=1561963 RepID=A0A7S0H8K5_9EUKA|mmetsp:Transcript_6275/g.9611  ORF Transcript_6275/g.9611 Transcript_6275/m.9611 type:complete len:143 (+) Transcript_6275:16-444(+)